MMVAVQKNNKKKQKKCLNEASMALGCDKNFHFIDKLPLNWILKLIFMDSIFSIFNFVLAIRLT
jgi:hypothetical protein